MPTVRENILENIRTTLLGVAVSNGYENTLQSVQRWDKRGNPLKDVPCVIISAGSEKKEPTPNPLFTCRLTVFLDVWIRQDASDLLSTDSRLSSIVGDIGKAVMADYTRGGWAKVTNDQGSAPFESVEGQPHAGLAMEIEVVYQHRQNDPSVVS